MKTRNPVAKHAPKFNRSKVEKPKKGKGSYKRPKNQTIATLGGLQ